MIKVEHIEVFNFKGAIRGMRNPMNSWEKSDSVFCPAEGCGVCDEACSTKEGIHWENTDRDYCIGDKDLDLMRRLYKAGTEHRKYARQIFVSMDITAPLYWWKEADQYRIGVTTNSCSTMHKIHDKEFTINDFSHEHLVEDEGPVKKRDNGLDEFPWWRTVLSITIDRLNYARELYLETKDKKYWWQMIQTLPSSYNQRRTITMSYENVFTIIKQRTGHKLDEWNEFVEILKTLPYVREIMEEPAEVIEK